MPYADPDDDLRLLARQLLRRRDVIDKLEKELVRRSDDTLDLINANRDIILRIHEEGLAKISKLLIGGGNQHDAEKLVHIGKILHAISVFHPMHGESWIGWPEEMTIC